MKTMTRRKGSGYSLVLGTSLGCSAWSPLVLAPSEAKPSVLPAEPKELKKTKLPDFRLEILFLYKAFPLGIAELLLKEITK